MDEFEVLIAIVVGVFKLIAWIFKTLFRGVRGIARLGRGPQAEESARPELIRIADPKKQQRERAKQPLKNASFVAVRENRMPSPNEVARYKNEWEVPPPPPPGSFIPPPPRRRAARPQPGAAASTEALSPEMVRDAIVLDAIFRRR